ncbi:hypothetical protein DMUE_4194 [Dictyocoela muelleri]|nr:hypothetical protein DMUE_4194 [Dictyocoela muelleri]
MCLYLNSRLFLKFYSQQFEALKFIRPILSEIFKAIDFKIGPFKEMYEFLRLRNSSKSRWSDYSNSYVLFFHKPALPSPFLISLMSFLILKIPPFDVLNFLTKSLSDVFPFESSFLISSISSISSFVSCFIRKKNLFKLPLTEG